MKMFRRERMWQIYLGIYYVIVGILEYFCPEIYSCPVGINETLFVLLREICVINFFRIWALSGSHQVSSASVDIIYVAVLNPKVFGTISYAGVNILFSNSISFFHWVFFARI